MHAEGVADDTPRRARRVHPPTIGVVVACVTITVGLSIGAQLIHDANEDRLLRQRAREAAATLTTSVGAIQTPLVSASDLAEATNGDAEALRNQLTVLVTAGERFVSASVWRLDGSQLTPVVVVGDAPSLESRPPEEIRAMLVRAAASPRLAVFDLTSNPIPTLGYSVVSTTPDPSFVAYVERVLPPNRTRYARTSDAFSGLDNAVYLGARETPEKLLTASTPDLPLEGRRSSQLIEFGDTSLRVVVSPNGDLSGSLAGRLWWLLLIAGAVVTVAIALLVERLQRRRDEAEELAEENRRLYATQRNVAQTLQHSLLPRIDPTIGGLAFASLYEPATTEGVDIGGDWYDAISVDGDRVMFAVGDVSGRGLRAATVMASMRYSIRAFANHGLGPSDILTELSSLLDVGRDGHFATVVCGVVDVERRQLTFATAGHPPLLLVGGGGATFAHAPVGHPVGIARHHVYGTTTLDVSPDTTIVAFTDGLYERRGETVDVGLERLRAAGDHVISGSDPADVLGCIRDRLRSDDTHDDTAMLGVAWTT